MLVLIPLAVATALVISWFGLRHFAGPGPFPVWLASFFDNPVADSWSGVHTIINRAGISSGMRVIDAGCGPGRLTIPLALRVGPRGEVVALDVQEGMLSRVRERATEAGLTNVRTVTSPLEKCSHIAELQGASFDRVLLVTVLGEIRDRDAALRGLYGALKPSGVLSVTELLLDPDYVPQGTVQRLAHRSGFQTDGYFGNPLMFTANFKKPVDSPPGVALT